MAGTVAVGVGLGRSRDGLNANGDRPQADRGVSLAGPEFGTHRPGFCNANPGRHGVDYTYNSKATVEALAAAGFSTFRLPFRWERIQPQLGGPLNAAELGRLREAVAWVASVRGRVVLDLHNYGRYALRVGDAAREVVLDERIDGRTPVTSSHLCDLWRRLAGVFSRVDAVVGYGLMNEPHDMGAADWRAISQRVVEAIRRVDRRTYVFVGGDGWSNAHRWTAVNGDRPWVDDPAGRVVYEAHCYFDHDASGKYRRSHVSEQRGNPDFATTGVDRVRPFVEWCRKHDVKGFVGEYGVPGDEPGWGAVTERFLAYLDAHEVPSSYWAAGEWWGDYRLSIQPREDGTAAPQLRHVMQRG